VAKLLKIKDDIVKKTVLAFEGLPHRLEAAGEKQGVRYFNDSFATTPESTITALNSFAAPVILIAGGADKGADFKTLALSIKKMVKNVILLSGEASPRIEAGLLAAGYPETKIKTAGSMTEAVEDARNASERGDIILLSPACASFGMFTNYKERGDLFKKEVSAIH
jgi:UDP-N-acetylmuramoylalanine--D-glutamate ligase